MNNNNKKIIPAVRCKFKINKKKWKKLLLEKFKICMHKMIKIGYLLILMKHLTGSNII